MSGKKLYRGKGYLGALSVGGSAVKKVEVGTLQPELPAIAAGSSGTADVALSGVADGDIVMLMPDGREDGLIYAGADIPAAGTVRTYWAFVSDAGSSGTTTATMRYIWYDFT